MNQKIKNFNYIIIEYYFNLKLKFSQNLLLKKFLTLE